MDNVLQLWFPILSQWKWFWLLWYGVVFFMLYYVIVEVYSFICFWKNHKNKSFALSLFPRRNRPKKQLSQHKHTLFHFYRTRPIVLSLVIVLYVIILVLAIPIVWKIIGAIVAIMVLFIYKATILSQQRKAIIADFPLFLQTLGNALKAGYSLEQAFDFLAQEIDPPLQGMIQDINTKISLKVDIKKALHDFANIIDHPDVQFFVESTNIQMETGGNLVELFDKISEIIEERRKLKADIKSFTSQGKMSGILIASLWPISLVLFSLISPQYAQTLFYTPIGQLMLAISFMLELIGFFFIWKIIRVKI